MSLLRVTGSCGSGLPGKRVHGPQELISDASGLAQPAEQGAVDCGGVIPDRVLPREEQARDGLSGGEALNDVELCQDNEEFKREYGSVVVKLISQHIKTTAKDFGVVGVLTCEAPGMAGPGVMGCAIRS